MTDKLRERCIAILDEAASEITRLQEALAAAEARMVRAMSLIDAMMHDDPNEPVSDAGHSALDLWKHTAEQLRSGATLTSDPLPALLAETRKKALEEAAAVADMMGIDSRTEATARAAGSDYHAANHFNAHALGCEQVSAALLALQENSNG